MQRTFLIIIALIAGLIFFAGSVASFAAASRPAASKKQNLKKPYSKKKKG
jgi:hypothetical protein